MGFTRCQDEFPIDDTVVSHTWYHDGRPEMQPVVGHEAVWAWECRSVTKSLQKALKERS